MLVTCVIFLALLVIFRFDLVKKFQSKFTTFMEEINKKSNITKINNLTFKNLEIGKNYKLNSDEVTQLKIREISNNHIDEYGHYYRVSRERTYTFDKYSGELINTCDLEKERSSFGGKLGPAIIYNVTRIN